MTVAARRSPYLEQLARDKRDFLDALHTAGDARNWVVAVGNEAGDLDSLASALAYAHFAAAGATSSSRRYVPLLLTARPDLHLRPENALALSSAGISPDLLLTMDDLAVPSDLLPALGGARFALVDHNSLLPPFRAHPDDLSDPTDDARVVAILDHHVDEGRHAAASPRRIEVVGSCASLLADQFVANRPGVVGAAAAADDMVPRPIADLLLSSILIDTRLRPLGEGGKAAPLDLAAVHALLPYSSFTSSPSSSSSSAAPAMLTAETAAAEDGLSALQAHGDKLAHAKEDVSHLGVRDLLRRDYKEYNVAGVRYGLSTVPLPLANLLDKGGGDDRERGPERLVHQVRAWMDERGLDLAGVLTSYVHVKKNGKEGKHRREVALVLRGRGKAVDEGKRRQALTRVFAALEKDEVLQLGGWKDAEAYGGVSGGGWRGVEEGEEEGDRWRIWQQGNDRATRKQVAPSLQRAVEQAVGAEHL